MVKSGELFFDIKPVVADLTSGRYKLRTHCQQFPLDPERILEAKQAWAEEIEAQGAGELKVERVDFIQVGPGSVIPGWINIDGPTEIVTDQTIIETTFTVASPFPFTLLLIVIAIAIIAALAVIFQEEIEKVVDALYDLAKEYPGAVLFVLALLGLAAIGVKVPKRKEEKEKT